LPQADYDLIKNDAHFKALSDFTFKEACRKDGKGAVHEAGLYFNNFGFELSSIIQPVHYWWGTEDTSVVRLHAEAAEQQITDCIVHYKQGEGHLSLYIHCFAEVLKTISSLQD